MKRHLKGCLQRHHSTQLDVELSSVELCRYKRAFRGQGVKVQGHSMPGFIWRRDRGIILDPFGRVGFLVLLRPLWCRPLLRNNIS